MRKLSARQTAPVRQFFGGEIAGESRNILARPRESRLYAIARVVIPLAMTGLLLAAALLAVRQGLDQRAAQPRLGIPSRDVAAMFLLAAGAVLLLAWLAIRLFSQAAIAFVLPFKNHRLVARGAAYACLGILVFEVVFVPFLLLS